MEEYAQLGTLGIVSVLAIKEFFTYLKAKKDGPPGDSSNSVLKELQLMNSNHLSHIQAAIEKGTDRQVAAFNAHAISEHLDSTALRQVLGEIKGLLTK